MKKVIIVILLIVVSLIQTHASNYTFTFDYSKINVTNLGEGQNASSLITYEGFDLTNQIGYPVLPVKYISISVPSWVDKVNILTSLNGGETIILEHPISISQPMYGEGDSVPRSDLHVQSEVVECAGLGFLKGLSKVLKLAVYPCVYNQVDNTATFYTNIDVSLSYEESDSPTSIPLAPKGGLSEDELQQIKDRVINPNEVEINIANVPMPMTTDQEEYGYVIVAPKALCLSLERLASYRRLKGIGAKVFDIESILAPESRFASGDEISGLNDDAGKLRSFIQYAYQYYETKHVLLAGKYPAIPIRYSVEINNGGLAPSDLYFSELNGSWKEIVESSMHFCVNVECYSEVSVGRIPFSTVDEVDAYIDNLIEYELNPSHLSTDYLNKALMTRQDHRVMNADTQYGNFRDDKIDNFFMLYSDDNLIDLTEQAESNFPNGSDVISKMNSNPCGMYNFIGHGNPGGIATRTVVRGATYDDDLFAGVIADQSCNANHLAENGNAIASLRIKKYPYWIHTPSCSSMTFDGNREYPIKYNFAEACLFETGSSCVAFYGNTHDSQSNQGEKGTNLFFEDLRYRYLQSVAIPGVYAGEMMNRYREYDINSRGYACRENLIHNLMGDPMVNLWIYSPSSLSCVYGKDAASGNYVASVSGYSPSQLYVSNVYVDDATYSNSSKLTDAELDSIVVFPNMITTIFGKGNYPLILPLRIGGMSFAAGKKYIFANSVTLGEYAGKRADGLDTSLTTFERNSEVKIEALGNVTLSEGVQFKSGSKLMINSKGRIVVNLSKIPAGVTLMLNARSVIGNFTVDRNADVRINGVRVISRLKSGEMRHEGPSMVVEGRTWWYTAHTGAHGSDHSQYELGVQIGASEEIDGVTWNRLNIVKSAEQRHERIPDKINEWNVYDWTVSDSVRCFGHIREEDNRVFVLYDYHNDNIFYTPIFSSIYEYCDRPEIEPLKIYDFNDADSIVTFGRYVSEFERTEADSIVNSGFTYRVFNFVDKSDRFLIPEFKAIPEIGVIVHGDICGDMFCAPFAPTVCDTPITLRYVTDPDGNVMYEGIGGLRAWDDNELLSESDILESEAPARWYNLQGIEVVAPTSPGVYIKLQGGRTAKVTL